MKRFSFIILFMLVTGLAIGQHYDQSSIDEWAESVTATTPDSLSLKLTAPYSTDRQKVRSIFRWITANIEYDMTRYTRLSGSSGQIKLISRDTTYDDRSLNERISYMVMKKGKAVCDGYARLFQTLCDYAGVRSIIINGYARSEGDKEPLRFNANHSWNAVFIDSSWHLLDATWAAGYVISGSNTFVKSPDDAYYLAKPERFAQNHYPEDPQWSLLTEPHTPEEFRHSPFKPMAFYKYGIQSFLPTSGILEAAPGDTLQLRINANPKRLTRIGASGPGNEASSFIAATIAQLNSPIRIAEGILIYQYIIPPEPPEWLNLIYNEDVVLRYRLRRKS